MNLSERSLPKIQGQLSSAAQSSHAPSMNNSSAQDDQKPSSNSLIGAPQLNQMKGAQTKLLTLNKAKAIQGNKVSEITVQGTVNQAGSNTIGGRTNIEILSPTAVSSILAQSPMYTAISTPQKFRLKTHHKKHGGSVLKPSTASTASLISANNLAQTSSFLPKKYAATLSKVTSEKRLGILAQVDAESKAAYSRVSPRNAVHTLSDDKGQKTNKLQANKKQTVINPQPIINSQLQQANEYLASTKPMSHSKSNSITKDLLKSKKLATGTQRQLNKAIGNQEQYASVLVQNKYSSSKLTKHTDIEIADAKQHDDRFELQQITNRKIKQKHVLSPSNKVNQKQKQFFDGRSHEEKNKLPDQKSSSKKNQYVSAGPPQAASHNVLSEQKNVKRPFLSSEKKVRKEDEPLDDDDYEMVMAEEVDDNLICLNRAQEYGYEVNELDEATLSYREESANVSSNLPDKSDRKRQKAKPAAKSIYQKKVENQKENTFKPSYERPSVIKNLAMPDSFEIDTSVYNARNTQQPQNELQSNSSLNEQNLNNLLAGLHTQSATSVKNTYAKTFHQNVYTNYNQAQQFYNKVGQNSNQPNLAQFKGKAVSPSIFKQKHQQKLQNCDSNSSQQMRPGSQSMSYIPPRRLNDNSVNQAASTRPEDMSLEDEKLTSSPDPVFKGLKASNKEKTLKRIALGSIKNPLAKTGAQKHFQSSAEMFSSVKHQQGATQQISWTKQQRKQNNSQTRQQQREQSLNSVKNQPAANAVGINLVSQFAKKVSSQQQASLKQMQLKEAKLREKTKKNLKLSTQLALEKYNLKKPISSLKEAMASTQSAKKTKFDLAQIGSQTPQQHMIGLKLLENHKQRIFSVGSDAQKYSSGPLVNFVEKRRSMQSQGKKSSVQNLHKLDKPECNRDGKLSERYTKPNSNSRKWAHSLTDNYRGEQIDQVIARDLGPSQLSVEKPARVAVRKPSRVSSSGSASNLIPSEGDRNENQVNPQNQERIKTFNQLHSVSNDNWKAHQSFIDRKNSSSCDKPPTCSTSQLQIAGSISMSRASSKHMLIEPHRMVKVSKPTNQGHFVASSNLVQKNKQISSKIEKISKKKKKTSSKFQSLLEPTHHFSKKSGSFGGSFNEQSMPVTPSVMSQSASKKANVDRESSFGMGQAILRQQIFEVSSQQSPHAQGKKMTFKPSKSSHGPGSLIANSNQVRQHSTSVLDQAVSQQQPVAHQKFLMTQHDYVPKSSKSPSKNMLKKHSNNSTTGLIIPLQPQSEKSKKFSSKIYNKDISPKKISLKNNVLSIQNANVPKNKDTDQSHIITQGNDKQRTENFQLLRQVHGKQITTASKGKDGGGSQFQNVGNQGGKSYSVLVPSAESVAQSKAMLLDHQDKGVDNNNYQPKKTNLNSIDENNDRAGKRSFVENVAPLSPMNNRRSSSNDKQAHKPQIFKQKPNQDPLMTRPKQSPPPLLNSVTSPHEREENAQSALSLRRDPDLNVIEERIETQDSAISDPDLTPRTKIVKKIHKKIKISFIQTGNAPETQTEYYKIGKVMGKGAFGKVNLAIHRLSSKFVALKSINKQFMTQEESKKKVMQEFNMLRRTRHCNIVRLYESFETQQHIVFVMEVCGGGDLLTYVRRRRKLKEDVAKHLFVQIITGMRYCHKKNVLHRDIKLDNILLTSQGDVKICDFGVSKLVTDGETMTEQCGTPAYIAPEVFENKGYQGYASDVWSAGVVLYAMLFGAVPFKASNMNELHKQVVKCKPNYKDEISKSALDLLQSILVRDPRKRLTEDQILQHPWMIDALTKKVNVFSEQEKEGIVSEFEYYNVKRERESSNHEAQQVQQTDPFAEQMLSSTQNDALKNASTKSIILAPFNSTKSQISSYYDSIKDMMQPRNCIKFSAKVKEIDRQYEMNNNADLDNGVYHQEDEESNDIQENSRMVSLHDNTSIATSFNQQQLQSQLDDLQAEESNSVNSADLEEVNHLKDIQHVSPIPVLKEMKKEKLSEWRKLEKQMLTEEDLVTPEKLRRIPDQEVEQSYEQIQIELFDDDNTEGAELGATKLERNTFHRQTLIIDDEKVAAIEKTGYPRTYIMASLNNDDLNHATTFYYLLQAAKEY